MGSTGSEIAIVGMACRVPGARSVRDFWRSLLAGQEAIRDLSDAELLAAGETEERIREPGYVKRAATFENLESFDAELFGFSPREAAILDPQHRHFYEVCWEALEDAAWDPSRFEGAIGIYGGCGMGAYFAQNLLQRPDLLRDVGLFLLRHTGNDKDFLTTRVAYLMNLQGPAVNVQTACSTSLVAVHQACQALLGQECDMALAGGVTLELPHGRGYLPRDGEILSTDGKVYAFDHRARGTVFGSGAGVVVLRRLDDAVADGDRIHAVIRGTAINNDGGRKVGYLAPSVDGQAAVMAEVHELADVPAETIGMVECHGTGTQMGDPIEVAALTQAFRQTTDRVGFARIGSVKTNIGHLDTAAGAASLIKAALAVRHGQIPASLNFEKPNPSLDLDSSPFRVASERMDWPLEGHARRAAVNSLGVGGTNAYVLIEQPPDRPRPPPDPGPHLLPISGHSRAAVEANTDALAEELASLDLADVSYTLVRGRRALSRRRVVVAEDGAQAQALLRSREPTRVFDHTAVDDAQVVFMLPGGGSQHAGMGRDLLRAEPVFRKWVERGADWLRSRAGIDLMASIEGNAPLDTMALQLPAIFVVSLALARAWMERGVHPQALIGHSLGENTAACLAEVFSFEEGLELVWQRGCLFDRIGGGAMLSVPMAAAELLPRLEPTVDLAVVNGPELCLVSGPSEALERLEGALAKDEIEARRVDVPVAAHSRYLDPILDDFEQVVRRMKLSEPRIPIVSNMTGTWLTAAEATDPKYWVRHLRQTVRFSDGLRTVLGDERNLLLEVGPGRTLSSLARQQQGRPIVAIPSMPHAREGTAERLAFRIALGRLWASGAPIDLRSALFGPTTRTVVDLPTYAFQHGSYWLAPSEAAEPAKAASLVREPVDRWVSRQIWREDPLDELPPPSHSTVLLFEDDAGLGGALRRRLEAHGHTVLTVRPADVYRRVSEREFVLSPERGLEGYQALLEDLIASGLTPERIVHAWLVTDEETFRPGSSFLHRNLENGFYSLFFLAQALADDRLPRPLEITVLTTGMIQVEDEPLAYPEKSTVLGPVKVIPKELPGIQCRAVDVQLERSTSWWAPHRDPAPEPLLAGLEQEIFHPPLSADLHQVAALRRGRRYTPKLVHVRIDAAHAPNVTRKGTYLVTGGLGGIGLTIAEHLLEQYDANVVIVTRREIPPRVEWTRDSESPLARLHRLDPHDERTLVISVDVTDIEGLREAKAKALEKLGPLRGVFHAAGTTRDSPIAGKTQTECEDVFAPKIFGTLVLEQVLEDQPLDFFTVFSSTSTWLAPPGQADYVAANAFLNAFARRRHGPGKPTFAVHWGIWNEVGLAARTLEPDQARRRRPSPRPWVDAWVEAGEGPDYATTIFDARAHWLLDEHRTALGQAVMPGTGFVELLCEATHGFEASPSLELQSLFFSRPLFVEDAHPLEVRVELKPTHQGFDAEVRSRRQQDGRMGWELHAAAQLHPRDDLGPARLDLGQIRQRCPTRTEPQAGRTIRTRQDTHLRFGPRWKNVRRTWLGEGEGLAELELDPTFEDDDCRVHPALLDSATGFGLDLLQGYRAEDVQDALYVPVSYGRIRVHKTLPSRCFAYVRLKEGRTATDETIRWDLTLTDGSGEASVEVEDLILRRMEGGLTENGAAPLRGSEWRAERLPGPRSPAEEQLLNAYRLGIRPEEGASILIEAMVPRLAPAFFVSSIDLGRLAEATATAAAQGSGDGDRFKRPSLDVEFVKPRDGVEKTLVGFWQELLGVDEVGIKDSFFDLGGHSLIAVRLFAKIRKTFDVDLPISVLFEAPSVERCAELIRSAGAAESEDRGSRPADRRSRFLYLVPMHTGQPAEAEPFFLVAGMFGNVLNLRHLAHQIGTDRPIYGVQARGLFGEYEPHDDFVDMARDYLGEIRQVQPQGPYLLGGFSGGGILAWEMAHQLRSQGETVSLLVLLDTRLPQNPPLQGKDRMEIQLQSLRRRGPSYVADWARRRVAWELRRFRNGAPESADPARFRDHAIEQAFRAALPKYQVPTLNDVPVVLFRPALQPAFRFSSGRMIDADRNFLFPDNGWGSYAPSLNVYEVPGNHDSMVLEPNVRVLANRLRRLMRLGPAVLKG